jgi:hypothetical protein
MKINFAFIRFLSLVAFGGMVSISDTASADQKYFCGTVSGREFTVDPRYVFMLPEEEGDSWTPRKSQPYNCSTVIKSLVIEFYQESGMPAGMGKDFYSDPDENHLSTVISPALLKNTFDAHIQSWVGEKAKESEKLGKNENGYYWYRGEGRLIPGTLMEIFWSRSNTGEVDQLIYCSHTTLKPLTRCHARFFEPKIPARVQLNFYWKDIQNLEKMKKLNSSIVNNIFNLKEE